LKNQLNEERLKDKFTEEDKTMINDLTNEGIQFVNSNGDASKEEFEAK